MLVVNSVCGCAAGMARPGVRLALQGDRRPDRVATVFAGQDLEATAKARSYIADIPPSSPSIAFLRVPKSSLASSSIIFAAFLRSSSSSSRTGLRASLR